MGLRGLLHLLQDEGRDLGRRVLLAVGLDPGVVVAALDDLVGDEAHVLLGHGIVEGAPDQALDGEEGALRIRHRLALGRLADEALAFIRECDDGRRRARPFRVLDDLGLRALHHGDAGIGCPEIDTDDFTHGGIPHFPSRPPGPEAARPMASI
jgi:hypothetical protein